MAWNISRGILMIYAKRYCLTICRKEREKRQEKEKEKSAIEVEIQSRVPHGSLVAKKVRAVTECVDRYIWWIMSAESSIISQAEIRMEKHAR